MKFHQDLVPSVATRLQREFALQEFSSFSEVILRTILIANRFDSIRAGKL